MLMLITLIQVEVVFIQINVLYIYIYTYGYWPKTYCYHVFLESTSIGQLPHRVPKGTYQRHLVQDQTLHAARSALANFPRHGRVILDP